MLESCWGNLLESDAEALVNTVNCVGVMGKGLALQFKQAFPENFREYRQACQSGAVQPGQMLIVQTGRLDDPRYIINFPTKRHWRNPSQIKDIKTGLRALIEVVKRLGIRSIAIPPLGCGNGGLEWSQVAPLIESAFAEVPEVKVWVFEPPLVSRSHASSIAPFPKLTRARALLIELMNQYQSLDNPLTVLEVQKLAYLLQSAGEPLRLQFMKGKYGPFAENLHPVLRQLEGYYIKDCHADDRAEIQLLTGAVEAAQPHLTNTSAVEVLERVVSLIEGFESPYGLEVLTVAHWVTQEDLQAIEDVEWAIVKMQQWSLYQPERLKPQHICKAWQRLHQQNWIRAKELA
ncbi:MAG: macro domain-containing protein [Lyngbya sp. HA4199-MV5]|jgi:O-acetyl-ADP-ribose deacetylase (regulator of RNase III)|nr:macro domain-containing protein [Lyngbya sp. HA4199-MV5]